MAGDQSIQGAFQRRAIKLPFQAQGLAHVEFGAGAFELIEEPEPLLRVGERQARRALWQRGNVKRASRPNERSLQARELLLPKGIDKLAHGGNGWPFKDRAQRQLDPEGAPDAGDQPGSQERLATALKEIVVDADLFYLKQLAPDGREGLFGGGARGHIALRRSARELFGQRERLAIY